MEENNQNITNNPSEKNESKKAKNDSKSKKQGSSGFVADHVAEFKKIVWPNKGDVIKKTATVIVTSIILRSRYILHGHSIQPVTELAYYCFKLRDI